MPVLLLGPALLPGYVLSYDMVWVPHLALRSDFLGLGPGVPRAVPSDAVVAVVDNLIPAQVLQKLVLYGALLLAGLGASRLVNGSVVARCVAISVAVWNPFVVERLRMGHWPVLLGYAVLPWLVVLVRRARADGRVPLPLFALIPLGSLSASAGLVTTLAVGVLGLGRAPDRLWGRLLALAAAANAPWVVAGLLHPPRRSGLVGAEYFALHSEGVLPAPLAALTGGGIWNAEVVPSSRGTALAWIGLIALAVLAAVGARESRRRLGDAVAWRLVVLWSVGYAVAVLTWLAPGAVDRLATGVPGAGLVRDGTRYLGLCLPLVLVAVATGAEAITRLPAVRVARVVAGGACALLPLMVLPDAAMGADHQLAAVSFPGSWSRARAALAQAESAAPGDLLVLPFSSYRAPDWNGGRKVLDPLGRYLTPDYVASDVLTVSGHPAGGDDPRVPRIERILGEPDPAVRASELAAMGIRYVVRDLTVAGTAEATALPVGRTLYADSGIVVLRLTGSVRLRHNPWYDVALMAGAWGAFLAIPVVGLLTGLRRRSQVGSRRPL
ncbi:MAG TPA: hypothetical protein VHO29_01865 [Marmoricola sp.]|nr:hypothetical protein [Marmoricola sp.]